MFFFPWVWGCCWIYWPLWYSWTITRGSWDTYVSLWVPLSYRLHNVDTVITRSHMKLLTYTVYWHNERGVGFNNGDVVNVMGVVSHSFVDDLSSLLLYVLCRDYFQGCYLVVLGADKTNVHIQHAYTCIHVGSICQPLFILVGFSHFSRSFLSL